MHDADPRSGGTVGACLPPTLSPQTQLRNWVQRTYSAAVLIPSPGAESDFIRLCSRAEAVRAGLERRQSALIFNRAVHY